MTNPPNIETIRATIAEEKAHVVQHAQSPRGYKTVLVRKWIDVEDELRGPCVAFLRDYGSANNKEPAKTVDFSQIGLLGFDTVTDPQASLYARDGVWMVGPVAEVRNPEGKIDIVQTLFRATTGPYLVQEIEESCEYVVERTLYLNSTVRPTIPGTRPAGTSYRISEIMVDPETGAFTGWLDKRMRQYRNLQYDSAEDAFVATATREQDGVTNESIPTVADPDPGTIVKQRQELNDDCSKKVDTDTLTAKAVADATLRREITKYEQTDVDLDRNQVAAATLPASQTPGEIREVTATENEFQRFDNETKVRTATSVSDAEQSARVEKYETSGVVVDRNQTAAASLPESQTAGTIVTVKDQINDFARHDITTETRVAVAVSDAETTSEKQAFEEVAKAVDRNQTSAATPPASQTAGEIVAVRDTINEFARHDIETTTRTAVAQSAADRSGVVEAFEKADVVVDKNQTSAASIPASQTAGTIVKVSPRLNEFLRYDNETETRTAIAVSAAEQSARVEKYRKVEEVVDRNQTSAASLPVSQTAGTLVTVKDELNAFQRHDISTETQTATAVSNAEQSKAHEAFQSVERATDRNQASAATLPSSQTAGTIVDVKDTINDFARHDIETVTRTAVAVSNAEQAKRIEAFESNATALDRNQTSAASMPGSQTAGTIVTVKAEKNEFARFDNLTETRTAIAASNAEVVSERRAFETLAKATDRNQTSAASPPGSQTAGQIVTVRDQLNEFARHDIETSTRVAVAVSNAEQAKEIAAFETRQTALDRNQAAPGSLPGSQTPGQIVVVKTAENEFARHDVETITRTATQQTDAETSSRIEKFQTVETALDKNLSAAADVPVSQTAGTVVTVKNALNEFQRYDAETSTVTATAVADAEKSKEIQLYETVERDQDKNQESAASLPGSQTAGTIVVVKDVVNEFDRHDIETVTRTATAISNAEQRKSIEAFESREVAVNRNQSSAGSLPGSQTAGTIVEVKTSQNEFARHDVETLTRTAVAVTNAEQEKTVGQFETVAKATDRNQTAAGTLPSSQTAGTLVTVNTKQNEFQRHDVETVTRTATSVTDSVREKTISGSRTELQVQNRNQSAAETEETVITTGTVKTTKSEKNEFQRYDNQTVTRTATKQDTDWRTFTDVDGDKSYREFSNVTAIELAAIEASITDDYKGSVRSHLNEFNLYDGYATREPAITTLGGFDTGKDFDYEVTTEKGTFHVYVRLTSNRATASDFMSDSPANNWEQAGVATCGIHYIGKGIYKATKIVKL